MFSEKDFQTLIPDEGIRNYILGGIGGNPFDNTQDYYTIFHNIINLAFMYAFSCYTDMRNRNVSGENELGVLDKCRRNGNANSLRVLRTMEKIYSEYPISNELIQFVLLDIQFDFMFGIDSRLMDYFPNCFSAKSAQLNEYFTMVNLSLVSSRLMQYNLETLEEKLKELIAIFPFLYKSSLKFSDQAGWYIFEINKNRIFTNGRIYTYGLIHRIKRGRRCGFYYLASIEKNILRYENYADSQFCTIKGLDIVPTGKEILPPYELSWDEEAVYTYLVPNFFRETNRIPTENKAKIEQLFNINYKYIKNLALAISDSVGRDAYRQCGEALIAEFGKTYPEIFQSYQKNTRNWDSIIVMLLIEASPSRVLKVVFLSNPNIGNVILRSLKHHFGAEFSSKLQEIQTNDDFNERAERMIEVNQLHLGNQPIETKIYNCLHAELLAEAKATIILSALSNMKQEKTYGYTGNIGQGVESLENFTPSDNPECLCQAIRETLGVVLERVTCFYAGLFAYGEKKMEYDKKSESHLLSQEEIEIYQNLCKKAFETAVKKQWRVFVQMSNKTSILAILQEFLTVCQKCNESSSASHHGRSDESRYLYTVLGKYSVLDTEAFERELKDAEAVGDLSPQNATWWQKKAIRLMRFLATGGFEQTSYSAQIFQRAIAPVVASYNRFENNKDGYESAIFDLTIDVNGNNVADYHRKINVLSEFSYDMHTQYYCLPNIGRSNEKWWIDPFVIECEIINKICTR